MRRGLVLRRMTWGHVLACHAMWCDLMLRHVTLPCHAKWSHIKLQPDLVASCKLELRLKKIKFPYSFVEPCYWYIYMAQDFRKKTICYELTHYETIYRIHVRESVCNVSFYLFIAFTHRYLKTEIYGCGWRCLWSRLACAHRYTKAK